MLSQIYTGFATVCCQIVINGNGEYLFAEAKVLLSPRSTLQYACNMCCNLPAIVVQFAFSCNTARSVDRVACSIFLRYCRTRAISGQLRKPDTTTFQLITDKRAHKILVTLLHSAFLAFVLLIQAFNHPERQDSRRCYCLNF